MFLEVLVESGRQGNVLEHALQLGRELTAALGLEFTDHQLLRLVGSRFVVEQSVGEVSLVVEFEGIFFFDESEEIDHFAQKSLHFGVGDSFEAVLELVVDEEREVFRRSRIQVQEVLEVATDDLKKVIVEKNRHLRLRLKTSMQ